MKRALFVTSMALVALAGCGDDSSNTTAAGGGGASSSSNGGSGGSAGGGQGGDGAQGGSTGQGGEGGGQGGGGSGWESDCLVGCQKLDTCGFANACGTLMVQCEQPDPMDLAACLVKCSAPASTNCDDINKYTTAAESPASPNTFVQCVSACPWPPGQGAPISGCTTCLTDLCGTEINACFGDTACSDWATCAGACTNPACFNACSVSNPNNFSDAVFTCACNMVPGAHAPVAAGAGTADCSDVCKGLMDPCNQ